MFIRRMERADLATSDFNALFGQLSPQHPRPHEWVLQRQLVDAAHQRQIRLTDWTWHVIHGPRLMPAILA